MPDENIQVICRLRPRSQRELINTQGSQLCVQVDVNSSSIRINSKDDVKSFTYDYSAGENTTQEELFDIVGIPVTKRCLEGYNGTILCYGQTGSGKTFTLFGDSIPERNRTTKSVSRGLVPRILEYLWNTIALDCQFLFKCSFYEIYQEKIFDLLDPTSTSPLAVREDSNLGVYVEGCTEQIVSSIDDAYQILSLGYRSRHVGETAMNRVSSRSHAIFQLTIEKTQIYNQNGVEISHVIKSRFSLVDLAGSERQRDTQTTGVRLREASVINKSLTCLGKVITELSSSSMGKNKRKKHINYRDSKLTFLLRDSLGGNSKTVLIATISPMESCIQETLSTLSFAQRSMSICNTTHVNECIVGSVSALQLEVLNLRAQIEELSKLKLPPHRSPQRQPLTPTRFSSTSEDKENILRINNNTSSPPPLAVCLPLSVSPSIGKLDNNRELIKINRELEDMLEEKEASLLEKDKEIISLKDAVEKLQYEIETIREMDEGRFGHTKVLMTTLAELKKENENLNVEVSSLRFVRDSLVTQAEKNEKERAELLEEMEAVAKDREGLEARLQDSNKSIQLWTERFEDLERQLGVSRQHCLEERTRADSHEISLAALKLRLQFLTNQQSFPPPHRTSRDTLFISSDQKGASDLENAWEVPTPAMEPCPPSSSSFFSPSSSPSSLTSSSSSSSPSPSNNEEVEDLDNGSVTEHNSDCADSVSTVQRVSLETPTENEFDYRDSGVKEASRTIKRGRSGESETDDTKGDPNKTNFFSKVFGYLAGTKKQKTDALDLEILRPPINLRCRLIEYRGREPERGLTNVSGSVLLSWESELPNGSFREEPTTFLIERAVLTQSKRSYTPYTQVGITDHQQFVIPVSAHPHSVLRFRVKAICSGATSEWSTTATIRTPGVFANTTQSELRYEQPFDSNGVFYWIGTAGRQQPFTNPSSSGEVKITLSCKWYPVDSSIYVEHAPKSLIFDNNLPCSWIEFDLGEGRLLVPTHYCLRGFENCKRILKSWELQAKQEEHSPWVTVSRHHNDSQIITLKAQQYPIGHWSITSPTESFRYFRLLQLDQNCKGMECSGVELYGTLIQRDKKQLPTIDKNSNQLSSF